MIYASSAPADDLEQSDSATDLAVQIAPLLPSSTSELAPPIILVPPSIARPRRLLDIPVAVDRVPFLGVVRQSQAVLGALAVDEVARGMALDHEVVPLGRADVDVCWVCARPVANLVASVVDDAQYPLRCRVRDFEPVACWHYRSDGCFDREVFCLLSNAICASHPSCCSGGSSSSSLGTSTASGVPNRASKYFHVAYIA